MNEVRNLLGQLLVALGRELIRPRIEGGSMAREVEADAAPVFWKINPPTSGIDSEGGFVPASQFGYGARASEPDIGEVSIVEAQGNKYLKLNPGRSMPDGAPRIGFVATAVLNRKGAEIGVLSADAVVIHGTATGINDGSLEEVEGDPTAAVPPPEEPPVEV